MAERRVDYDSVDAAMACVTVHHWQPRAAGLAEMRRVARGPVVVFTFDLHQMPPWQLDYLAEGVEAERPRFGAIEEVAAELGGRTRIETIPTPADCVDGFFEAFWNRPEALLHPAPGLWDEWHGHLREMKSFEGSLRLVVSEPER